LEPDWDLVANKSGATRLGFALLLKFYEIEGVFPGEAAEVPPRAVSYMAGLVGVDAGEFERYSWSSRTIEYHRAQIRQAFGTRTSTTEDVDRWASWMAVELCPVETRREQLVEALRRRCRSEKVEPPARGQIDRLVASAVRMHESAFASETVARLGPGACDRLAALLDEDGLLADLRGDPGRLGLETLFEEISKLATVQALGLSDDLFAGTSDRLVAGWRARAARMFPSDFRACAEPVRLTLLATLCWTRQSEITDGCVEILIRLIQRINARAERRVEKEMVKDLVTVPGKKGIYLKMVQAALDHPDETVRNVLWPVVPGGEQTLRHLARELVTTESSVKERVRVQLRGSYCFRCNNAAYRPVTDAIDLLFKYKDTPSDQKYFATDDHVPLDGVVPKGWREAVITDDGRIERVPYELCVLIALRDALRRREVWVEGANRWRDVEDDLPGDFDENRDVHYASIGKPLDPTEFVSDLRRRHREALDRFDKALSTGTAGGVRIVTRKGQPWITVPKLEKLPEPTNLVGLKAEVANRWGTLDLLDMTKDTDFLTSFTDEFVSVATREVVPRQILRQRLLLVLFALGTNMGIRQIAASGEHGQDEGALRRVRASHITQENLRRAIARVVNATFEARDPQWWGEATSTASDSKRFGSWESNLMTEFHARYGGYGVMIYWHVERRPGLHLLPTQKLFQLRSRCDARRPASSRHRRRHHLELHRHPRRLDGRVRLHRTSGLQAAPQAEEHWIGPPLQS